MTGARRFGITFIRVAHVDNVVADFRRIDCIRDGVMPKTAGECRRPSPQYQSRQLTRVLLRNHVAAAWDGPHFDGV